VLACLYSWLSGFGTGRLEERNNDINLTDWSAVINGNIAVDGRQQLRTKIRDGHSSKLRLSSRKVCCVCRQKMIRCSRYATKTVKLLSVL